MSDAIKAMKRKNSNTLSTNPNLSSSTGKSTKRKYGKSRSSVSSDDEPLSASVVSNKDKDMKNTTASVKVNGRLFGNTVFKKLIRDTFSCRKRRTSMYRMITFQLKRAGVQCAAKSLSVFLN